MEFIWVLVGVIFIIAMLSREGFFKFSERWLIIWMTIIVALVIGGCICKASTDNQNVIGAILGFAFQLGSIFFLLSLGVMLDVPEPPRKYSLHEIQSKFSQCGFNNIPLNKFTILIEDGYSPLKTFDLDSDGTVLKCYDWMFQKASWVIDNLSKKEVERRLGLAINDIPLDKSVPLDAALSKRGTLARDFLIQSNGLRYENLIRKTHISIADEYYSFFYDYVKKYSKTMDNTNCEDIQNQLSNNGYPVIASSSIKKLMEDPSSPLHDNHAAVDYCYDWMCEL